MSHSEKSDHERVVFLQFARSAQIPIDENSVEMRPPPEPDIRCICSGQVTYFELGRILEKNMQRLRIKAIKNAPKPVAVDAKDIGLAERDVLQAKLLKKYQVGSSPLELLLYFDSENPIVMGSIPPFKFAAHAKHVLEPLLTPMPEHIRRVWVFERCGNSILWRHPP